VLLLFALFRGLFVLTASAGSPSGMSYCLGLLLLPAGALMRRRLGPFGVGLIVLTAVVRLFSAARGETVVASGSARFIDRIVDEQDVAVQGARALELTGWRNDPDLDRLPAAMQKGYEEMRAHEGATPSAVVATYFGLNRAQHYDQLEVGDIDHARGVVIFLHGFAGGFTLPCWQFAQAAKGAGLATVCPNMRWRGDWWSDEGERIFSETLTKLKARGQRHIFVAGLSNGGTGASVLANRHPRELAGAILISGLGTQPPPVPTLVVYGERDQHYSKRRVALFAGAHGRALTLSGGHFAFLLDQDKAQQAIRDWLSER
jgi:hypothetical protein